MDQSLLEITRKRIDRTVKALCANNFDAHHIRSAGELLLKIDEYLPAGAVCTVGGSMTLFETGVIEHLKRADVRYLDRYAPDADTERLFREAFSADVYLTSANAITEDGMLYNMDGNGNRVAAMSYGPAKVIVVAGANKIVKTLDDARRRMREITAPANNTRLNRPNPCVKTGRCMDCKLDTTICSIEVVHRVQRQKNRITVLILEGNYGY